MIRGIDVLSEWSGTRLADPHLYPAWIVAVEMIRGIDVLCEWSRTRLADPHLYPAWIVAVVI